MFTKEKIHFLIWWHRKTFKAVESALGYKLYTWQKEYIVGASDDVLPSERAAGRTTAHILRTILGLNLKRSERSDILYDFDIESDREVQAKKYHIFYASELYRKYVTLKKYKVKCRNIKFNDREAALLRLHQRQNRMCTYTSTTGHQRGE